MSNRSKFLILLVDDDADLLATVREFLDFEGYDVETAQNGEDGLVKMEAVNPDMIILDMNMPGMGGIPFLKEMAKKTKFADIPVFVFTARANLEEFFLDTKVAGFMAKPCDPDDLLSEVRRILTGRPPREADPEVQVEVPHGGFKILLAEDEAGRRSAIEDAFAFEGWYIVTAGNGAEAMEKAVVERPDMIVMRVVLKGMNGDAVAAELGNIKGTRDIPILLYEDSGAAPRDRSDGGTPRRMKFLNTSRTERLIEAVKTLAGK